MLTQDGAFDLKLDFLLCTSTILLTMVVMLLAWLLYFYIVDMSRYPQGPLRIPAIGNILHLLWHGDILEFLMQSWKRYGDIFTIQIGSKMFIVLNGYETLNDALVKKARSFSEHNRFINAPEIPSLNFEGILFSTYPVWKEHRKLVLKVFKDLGFVKQDLEEKVKQEISKLIPEISSKVQQPFAIQDLLSKATSNVISNVVFGSRFEYDDKEFILLLDYLRKMMIDVRRVAISQLFPILRYLPIEYFKLKSTSEMSTRFIAFMEKKVLDVENNFASASPSYIKAYLEEIQKNEDLRKDAFTRSRCIGSVGDLFGAGSDSTATALEWAFLQCILHPDIQNRIHAEIDHVVGQRSPSLSDRQKMSCVNAFLTEVLRFGNIAALGLPHRVIHDVVLNGTCIPKDTEIIINLHSVLHDDKIFDEPSTFRPARFLDADGKFKHQEKLTPFGLGRRSCIGEELVQIELFLFFTATMQRFTFSAAPGSTPNEKALLGITRRPLPFKVVAAPR